MLRSKYTVKMPTPYMKKPPRNSFPKRLSIPAHTHLLRYLDNKDAVAARFTSDSPQSLARPSISVEKKAINLNGTVQTRVRKTEPEYVQEEQQTIKDIEGKDRNTKYEAINRAIERLYLYNRMMGSGMPGTPDIPAEGSGFNRQNIIWQKYDATSRFSAYWRDHHADRSSSQTNWCGADSLY